METNKPQGILPEPADGDCIGGMSENEVQPPPPPPTGKGRWWFAWIGMSIILPSFLGSLVGQSFEAYLYTAQWLGLAGLALHMVACWKLRDEGGCLFPFILLGGWVLMAVLFFVGCVNNMRFH